MNPKIPGFARKRVFFAMLVATLAGLASPASASCVSTGNTVCDTTNVLAFSGTSEDKSYTSNGFGENISGHLVQSTSGGNSIQSASDPFDTDKVIESLTESTRGTVTLALTYYTSYVNGELGTHFADLFLGNGKTDTFNSAIALGYQSDAKGFYTLNGASSYKTSEQMWGSKSGTAYGGEYKGFDSNWHYSPTVATSSATRDNKFSTSVSVANSTADKDAGGFDTAVTVTLSANVTDFNALFGSGLSVLWGTADCSNDPIEIYVANAPTRKLPEPMTLSLVGAGVAGAAVIRRRRRKI